MVHLKDGRSLRCRKAASLGTPDVPLSTSAVQAKFMSNATRAISTDAARSLMDKVMRIETAESLDEIMQLCTVA